MKKDEFSPLEEYTPLKMFFILLSGDDVIQASGEKDAESGEEPIV